MAKVVRALLLVAAAIGTGAAQVPASRSTPLFDVTSDDFWLNLHHYLYVIGRARTGAADAHQPAVANAPADEQQGRAVLTDAERVRAEAMARGVSVPVDLSHTRIFFTAGEAAKH